MKLIVLVDLQEKSQFISSLSRDLVLVQRKDSQPKKNVDKKNSHLDDDEKCRQINNSECRSKRKERY